MAKSLMSKGFLLEKTWTLNSYNSYSKNLVPQEDKIEVFRKLSMVGMFSIAEIFFFFVQFLNVFMKSALSHVIQDFLAAARYW